jgi:hypothetical protein
VTPHGRGRVRPELAAAQARRVALGLVATGPLVGTAWIVAVTVNALPPWRQQLSGPWLALPLVGLALAAQSARRAASSFPGHPGHPPPDPRAAPPGALQELDGQVFARFGALVMG